MISVVIPARNEADHIGVCLESLTCQVGAPDFEVIVVDNGSTDATAELASRFAKRLGLKILSQPQLGRGAARAMGFQAARGDIILSTDADTVVPPDWVAILSQTLARSPAAAVTGTCKITDCRPLTNWGFNWFQPNAMRVYRLIFGHYWLTGSNFAVKVQAYRQSGGFDPKVRDLEDIELGFRLAKVGRIKFLRRPATITAGDRFRAGLIRGLTPYARVFVHRFALKRELNRD